MKINKKVGFILQLAIALVAVASLTLLFQNDVDAANPGIYWGAHLYGKPPDTVAFQPTGFISAFETSIAKKKMSIIAWGAPWEYPAGTMLPFQTLYFNNVRAHGSVPLLDWSSMAPGGPAQPKYKLTNITRGDFDVFITQWATAAKNWAHPFFLRFDWEMNGNWQFPWSSQLNGNKPADYIAAWRHVHDIFVRVGANNVTWVWAPNISTWNTIPLAQLYPGASYVDWIGLDGYNFYTRQAMPWESFSQIYSGDTKLVSNSKDSYTEIIKVAPGKPLIITEFTSVEAGDGGAKKAQWITDALTNAIPTKYPAIKAIVWFNWDAGAGLTWPVQSSAASINAFATSIAKPIYLTNVFSTLANGKVPPLR